MDQISYLSQTLWNYRGSYELTDVTLVCQDGSLPAHAVMMAKLLNSFGIKFSLGEVVPMSIILPDFGTKDMQQYLKNVYLQNRDMLPRKHAMVFQNALKTEVVDEINLKEDLENDIEDLGDDQLTMNVTYISQKKVDDNGMEMVKVERASQELQEKKYTCKPCEEIFQTKRERVKHRQLKHSDELEALGLATGIRDQPCPYCHKMYEKQSGRPGKGRFRQTVEKHIFKAHKRKLNLHPNITPQVKCDECAKDFYNHIDFRHHKKKVHGPQVVPYPCKLCYYKRAQTEEKLNKHMLENHSGVKYSCGQCSKSFKNKDTQRSHIKTVHGEKTEKCENCEKMFTFKGDLKGHVRQVHTKTKDKICPNCGEAFRLNETFKIHLLRHTGDRQFPCEVCGKSFFTERDIKQHVKIHTMPYKCDKCDKTFGSKNALNEHQLKHIGIKYECRFNCGMQAWYRRQRSNHEWNCSLNPVPGAPYSVAVGTASNLTLERYNRKMETGSKVC